MAIEAHSTTAYWAVVIGINFYPEQGGACLKSCARDEMAVKLFLEAQEPTTDITILTVTNLMDPSLSGSSEEPEAWPTFENIKSSLGRVFDKAKSGDVVYIHHSGHGTRLLSCSNTLEFAWSCC